jgi:hypothetical protein
MAVTCAIMNFISVLQPASPKHVTIVDGVVTKISLESVQSKGNFANPATVARPLMLSRLEGLAKRNARRFYFVIISHQFCFQNTIHPKVACCIDRCSFLLVLGSIRYLCTAVGVPATRRDTFIRGV